MVMIAGIDLKHRAAAWLFSAGLWMAAAMPGAAQSVQADIQSVSAPSGTMDSPFYVIDADAGNSNSAYDRDTFTASATVHFSLSEPGTASGTFRVAAQLVDDQGNAMDLAGATNQTAYSASQLISLDETTPTVDETFDVTIDPDQDLGAGGSYHVKFTVQKQVLVFHPTWHYEWIDVDGPDDSPSFVVVHFTGSGSSDFAYNVRGYTTGAGAWEKVCAVDTDPDKDGFRVSVPFRLMRYDAGENWVSSLIDVRLDVDLFDENGQEVPLVDDGVSTTSVSMLPYCLGFLGSPSSPCVATGDFEADFRPEAQLDSVHHRYHATVNVKHLEIRTFPAPTYWDDGTEDVPQMALLHFNGTLMWGSLATTMGSVSNNPVPMGYAADYVETAVRIDGNEGRIPSRPDLRFGTDQTIGVRLYADGHAEVDSGEETVGKTGGGLVDAEYGHVKVIYSGTRLSKNGPYAESTKLILPQGLEYAENISTVGNRFDSRLSYTNSLELNEQFRHEEVLRFVLPSTAGVFDEARPLVFGVDKLDFYPSGRLKFQSTGTVRYCYGNAFEQLRYNESKGYYEAPEMAERMTNDGYLEFAEIRSGDGIEFVAAADGSARLDRTELGVAPGAFTAHFPVGARIEWNDAGMLSFENGGLAESSELHGVSRIDVPFDGSCQKDGCLAAGSAEVSVVFRPKGAMLAFSFDGSLHGPGDVDPVSLQWGLRSDGSGGLTYSHRTDEFSQGVFEMAGQFIYSGENPTRRMPWLPICEDLGPATILYAGGVPDSPDVLVYPTTPEYAEGVGFYAGVNFVAEHGMGGASRIGGATSDYTYTLLDDASKYYVRRGGLSGRHVPKDGTYSDNLQIYGYDFEVTLFQLAFLSNQNVDSWFDGAVSVPYPSDFKQAFKGLTLTCTGDLDHAEIDPDDAGPKPLRYWGGGFTPLAVSFAEIGAGSSCYPDRALVIGLATEVSHVEGSLAGKLAFLNNGNIATPADQVSGADGRIGLPASITFDGPKDKSGKVETWRLEPESKLFFNNPDYAPASEKGFVTFAGSMNVPWFEDVHVQLITNAKNPDNPGGASGVDVYLTGGWEDPTGHSYFSDSHFDPHNKGYPYNEANPQDGIDLETYKNLPTGPEYSHGHDEFADYRVKARQTLFHLISLNYPLTWSVSGRYFKSAYPVTDNLVVIKDLFHQVDYMSPGHLDVSFGAKYEGMPRINLAGAAFEAVGEQVGAVQALTEATSQQVVDALNQGVKGIDSLASDALEDLTEQLLQTLGTGVFDPFYDRLSTTYQTSCNGNETLNDWLNALDATFDTYLGSPSSQPSSSLRWKLDQISKTTNDALSVVNRAREAVEKGIEAIDAITRTVNGEDGLLVKDGNGQRAYVQALVGELIKRLAGEEIASALSGVIDEAGSDFNRKLNELLSGMDPTFDQLVEVLEQLRGYLVDVRDALDDGGELMKSFDDIVNQGTAELDAIVAEMRTATRKFITELTVSAQMVGDENLKQQGNLFGEFSREGFRSFLTAQIRDFLLQSNVYRQFQYALRQWVADLDEAMHNAIDGVFAEVQNLVRKVIDEALGPIDDAINGVLGDINKYLGAGSIQGSAQFNGNSLKRLRLDGEFQFKIPDDMGLHAYLEILCYESGDDFAASGCLKPGDKALEVKLGATDVNLDWISPDMRADMEVKFSMDTSSGIKPIGVGGSFEMTGGSLNFQAFKITEFGAGVGVGRDECYIAAHARMIFSSYELAGGLFFGKTCTIEPLKMIDEDVASLLGNGPFTGAYVYGEVWLPISEMLLGIPASCMFEISAGVGAGAFYFVQGPTWGGQMLLGVSGEALCVVSIKGTVKMIGVMAGDSLRFAGKGSLSGKAGACPFCVKFHKTARMSYQDGDWSVDL